MILKVGEEYDVRIEDCCIEGKFRARVLRLHNEKGELVKKVNIAEERDAEVFFSNGVSLTCIYACEFKEVE